MAEPAAAGDRGRGEALSPEALLFEAAVAHAAPDGGSTSLTLRRKAGEPFTAYVEAGRGGRR